jgi:hypothetical protein
MNFTDFERVLLTWFINHSPDAALVDQLRAAMLISRDYTGAGMYLDLSLPAGTRPLPAELKSPINGPQISAPSLPNGAGSLLFHEDGVISFVEVYTYTDELFDDITDYRLHTA